MSISPRYIIPYRLLKPLGPRVRERGGRQPVLGQDVVQGAAEEAGGAGVLGAVAEEVDGARAEEVALAERRVVAEDERPADVAEELLRPRALALEGREAPLGGWGWGGRAGRAR